MIFSRVCQNGERIRSTRFRLKQTKFVSLLYQTNRFHVAERLSSNRSHTLHYITLLLPWAEPT